MRVLKDSIRQRGSSEGFFLVVRLRVLGGWEEALREDLDDGLLLGLLQLVAHRFRPISDVLRDRKLCRHRIIDRNPYL